MATSRKKTTLSIQAPQLLETLQAPLFPPEITKGSQVSEVLLTEWDFTNQVGDDLRLDEALIAQSRMSGASLRRARLRDVRFNRCDLSNVDWGAATLERVEVLAGRMTGLKAVEAVLRDVRFVDCKLDFSQFRFAKFASVGFERCVLREADFQGADLRGVSFKGSDLTGAQLTGAQLVGADFRGAQLDGIVVRPSDLKGMVIDAGQVIALSQTFAALLGVSVVD
jgi:uncharacterized protein YjbI with pentapeptide repeats